MAAIEQSLDDLFLPRPKSALVKRANLDDLFIPKRSFPAALQAERAILRQPSALERFVPPLFGLKALGQIAARGEAALAEPALTAVRRRYPIFGEDVPEGGGLVRGITGKTLSPRTPGGQTEFGDVIEEFGKRRFGIDVPDPISAAGGLAAATVLTGGLPIAGKAALKAGAIPIKASQKAAGKGAVRIAQGILRPTGKFAKRSPRIAESALKEGVLRSSAEGTQKTAQSRIDKLMTQIDEIAEASNITSDLRPAFRRVAAAAKYWIGQGKPERAEKILNEVTSIAKAKRLSPEKVLSAKELLRLRRSEDEALKRLTPGGGFFRETLPADIEARQEFAGGLRKALAKASPEIGEKNKRISGLIDVAKTAGKRASVSSRNNLLDIIDYALGTAGLFNPKAMAALAAKKIYQGTKAGLARGLYGYSQFGKGSVKKAFGTQTPSIKKSPQITFGGSPKAITQSLPKGLLPAPKEIIGEGFRTTPTKEEAFKKLGEYAFKYFKPSRRILEGEAGIQGGKESALKRFGINPITGEVKGKKIKTAIELISKRIRERGIK